MSQDIKDWMFVPPTLQVLKPLETDEGHELDSYPYKRDPRKLTASAKGEHSKKTAVSEQKAGPHHSYAGDLILDFLVSNWENFLNIIPNL